MPVAEKTAEKTIAESFLPEFDAEFANTRKFLALVPDDKPTWKPHDKSMELGRLAWHVSDFPSWCRDTLIKDALVFKSSDGEEMKKAWHGKTRADMLARFDADLLEARAALAATTDDAWAGHWKFEWDGVPFIDEPRIYVYRKWVVNHMIHHRAQLGVYLRLNDIAIPGCYGPSADEM
ncbi:MAG TPA: DinB family protein [Silvibacterium sp.]|nr:DinB family protein [Silvibacterium sp.]